MFGRQPEPMVCNESGHKTWLWVMPSSSARCAQLPRAVDKVPFYEALKKFRDHLSGSLPDLDPCEVVFANVSLKNPVRKIKTEVDDFGTYGIGMGPDSAANRLRNGLVDVKLEPYDESAQMVPSAGRNYPRMSVFDEEFIDYTQVQPVTDGRPAQVPASVDDAIDEVIRVHSGGVPGSEPAHTEVAKILLEEIDDLDNLDGLDNLDNFDEDDLDFRDEDSNELL
jgi:hypothetical protein